MTIALSIVIPCYNEAGNLSALVDEIAAILTGDAIEVILVNNGSTDDSAEILPRLLESHTMIRAVNLAENQGYGGGILAGLEATKGEFLGWMHADLQTPPADIIRAWKIIEGTNFDKQILVKGTRIKRPWVDRFFSVAMGWFESGYLKTKMTEINAQPTVFHRQFYEKWQQPPRDFSLDLYAYYMAKKYALFIHRFDVIFGERYSGESSWNRGFGDRVKFIKRTIAYSRKLKRQIRDERNQEGV